MASVDDRIVAMKFDNNSFQERVAATIASLDKLKANLDFTNAKKGMADLSAAGRSFNLDGIASAVEGIGSKFSAMGAIAFSVLNNITSRAVDAGIKIGKALSLDQVISGFREYETNMNSIQTILSNTKQDATTLDDVNGALDQLNTYSDQTIYNFSQMARNIGTFTAAGVDLDTSVQGIKGIANLAAISGSSADQASSAMYQLSQALASGSVKLMDWNSIVNAGMGGEVFQRALFDTGKSLKTIKGVGLETTFEEWKDAGNSFRGSLEQGWLTADVLTNTLSTFTGDLTEAQILSMGYTQDQVAGILELGKTGKDAATQVKTLTQLIGTVKESIGSGWSASFRIIFGDFEEAKNLFTEVNNAIGKMVGDSADARNKLLAGWDALGGRRAVIAGLRNAFEALAGILAPIKAAFQDIFPPVTAIRLAELSRSFRNFMEDLKPTPAVAVLITRAFRGIFAVFSIGIEVVQGIAHFFKTLFDTFADEDPNTGILGFAARLGDGIVNLKKSLVDGGGIKEFFDNLAISIKNFIENFSVENLIQSLKDLGEKVKTAIFGLFDGEGFDIQVPQVFVDVLDNLKQRFGWIIDVAHALGAVWDWIMGKMDAVRSVLGKVGNFIKNTFSNLPQKVADALSKTDYDTAVDTLNVGLFGGLVLLVKKFVDSNPLQNLSGLADKIGGMFDGVTKTLGAMQAKLKAEALMDIAKAIALLTASMVVLSLIDSGALTKSLVAMGIGFGQLVGVMTALNQISSGPSGGAKLALLATGLMMLAGAMLLLSIAMKIMSTMSWEEIAKGLIGVTVVISALVAAVEPLTKDISGMIRVGAGLILLAIALNIIALAMKSFAEMNWEEMAQGFVGLAGSLLIIAFAMKKMPNGANLALQGVGLMLIAVALNIMALALKSFAEMSWGEMLRGFVALGGMLLILTVAMRAMPNGASLALQGVGLLAIGVGLVAIASAMKILAGLSWEGLAKGLIGIAGVLIMLNIAAKAMEKALPGAVAIGIMAVSLVALAFAVKLFAKMSWGEMLRGMVGLAASLLILGVAGQYLGAGVPGLIGFGLALILIGAGFALIGLGATLLASAFSIIFTAIVQNVGAFITVIELLIEHIPSLIAAIADGLIQLVEKIVEALPGIIEGFGAIIAAIIQEIIDNIPLMAEAFKTFIIEGLKVIEEVTPALIATGLAVLMAFLQGIRDNIAEITKMVVDIITNFLDALAEKVPQIIDSVFNLVQKIVEGLIDKLVDIGKALIPRGVELLKGLLDGVKEKAKDVLSWFTELPGKVVEWIGNLAKTIYYNGIQLLGGLYDGIVDKAKTVTTWFQDLPGNIVSWVGDMLKTLLEIGKNLMRGLWNGLESMVGWIKDKVTGMLDWLPGWAKRILGIASPSKVFMEIGVNVGKGLVIGLESMMPATRAAGEGIVNELVESISPKAIASALKSVSTQLENMDDFNPTITPVMDLTNVIDGARTIGGFIRSIPVTSATVSYDQARVIAANANGNQDTQAVTDRMSGPTEIKFEQTINSPTPLSAADIYRQTRNQLAMAKEELAIP